MKSLGAEARRYVPGYHGGMAFQIDVGQIRVAHDLRWSGIAWTWDVILPRLMWFGVAGVLALLAAVAFDRFDTARTRSSKRTAGRGAPGESAAPSELAVRPAAAVRLTPLLDRGCYSGLARTFIAELRLALKGYRWWWYAVAAGLLIAQFASPLEVSRGPLLAIAWIWPTLVWSALGTREARHGTQQLVFSCARIVPRQLPSAWLAGVAVTALAGAGAAVRLALAGQFTGLLGWCAAAVFVPSLALALGVWSGTSKFFEGLYTALWYVGPMNRTPGLDFTGSASGPHAARDAFIYLALAAVLLATAFARRRQQLRFA